MDEAPAAPSQQAVPASRIQRRIIQTAALELEVSDVPKTLRRLADLAAKTGGFVQESSSWSIEGGTRAGRVIMRIPVGKFTATLSGLKGLGRVRRETLSGQDVTAEFVDVDARLRNLQREETRLLAVLDKAHTVEDILRVESELARVRGEIESAQGRLNLLRDQTDLATVTVDLSEPGAVSEPGQWALGATLRAAARAFLGTLRSLVSLAVWLVIYSPLILGAILVLALLRRYLRRKRAAM